MNQSVNQLVNQLVNRYFPQYVLSILESILTYLASPVSFCEIKVLTRLSSINGLDF